MTKVTIHDIADLLRDKSRWPSDFRWDYAVNSCCAMGLASLVLHEDCDCTFSIAERCGIPHSAARDIFLNAERSLGKDFFEVSPEDIATLIDRRFPRAVTTSIAIFTAMLNPSQVTVDAMNMADLAREIHG